MMTQETAASPTLKRGGIRDFFKNLLYWILDWDDEITLAEARKRMRNSPGLINSLTPGQLEYIRNYDGLENMGPPPDEPKPGLLTRMVEWLADDAPSPRRAPSEHKRGGLARVIEWLVDDAPTEEEVRRRLRSKPGFFSTLSPEARAAVLSYDGPESLGRPDARR